jgi:hypothetical protein
MFMKIDGIFLRFMQRNKYCILEKIDQEISTNKLYFSNQFYIIFSYWIFQWDDSLFYYIYFLNL